jgi:hypothetical protein
VKNSVGRGRPSAHYPQRLGSNLRAWLRLTPTRFRRLMLSLVFGLRLRLDELWCLGGFGFVHLTRDFQSSPASGSPNPLSFFVSQPQRRVPSGVCLVQLRLSLRARTQRRCRSLGSFDPKAPCAGFGLDRGEGVLQRHHPANGPSCCRRRGLSDVHSSPTHRGASSRRWCVRRLCARSRILRASISGVCSIVHTATQLCTPHNLLLEADDLRPLPGRRYRNPRFNPSCSSVL